MIVKKITLGQIPQLVAIVRNVPAILGGADNLDNATIVAKLPEIIETALPEVSKLVALITDIKVEEVQALGLAEFTDVVVQILEVNNVEGIIQNIKKAMALRAPKG